MNRLLLLCVKDFTRILCKHNFSLLSAGLKDESMNHKSAATILCSLAMGLPAMADTIHVPAGGDIHDAIQAASPGDTIQLSSGHYYISYPLNTVGKEITLQGAVPSPGVTRPNDSWPSTTIHATGPWPVLHMTFGETATFQYLHITNGRSFDLGSGGGLEIVDSNAVVNACKFDFNIASERGGAIAALNGSTAVITNSYFSKNKSMINDGGAVFADKSSVASVEDSVVCGNLYNPALCSAGTSQLSGTVSVSGSEVSCFGCSNFAIGDLNKDGHIDGADLTVVLSAWGSSPASFGACCHTTDSGIEICTLTYADTCTVYGGIFYEGSSCEDAAVMCGGQLASANCALPNRYGACCFQRDGSTNCGTMTCADCLLLNGTFYPGVTECSLLTSCVTGPVVSCCGCKGVIGCQLLPQAQCTGAACTNPATGAPGVPLSAGYACNNLPPASVNPLCQ